MGWQIGYDEKWKRDIGYGVPAICDQPECSAEIDRGLSYVCGGEPFGGEHGCGLYFCGRHLTYVPGDNQRCARCATDAEPFTPKPDAKIWMQWKLNDASWQKWRDENPVEVEQIRAALAEAAT